MNLDEHRCDVLVIGGGLAGMEAALEASRLGARVVIASEQKVGRSGNSVIAEAGTPLPSATAIRETTPRSSTRTS
jgi:succinate dehydrogenase/fumarate reductase flavoprotein subunit